jgi:hypothetical protein
MEISNYELLQVLFEQMQHDYEKFMANGNKSAGTRARVGLASIVRVAKDLRADIQEKKTNVIGG